MDNKMKIVRDEETHCISVCTKFEEFILIHEAMPMSPWNSLAGDKIIKSPKATWVK